MEVDYQRFFSSSQKVVDPDESPRSQKKTGFSSTYKRSTDDALSCINASSLPEQQTVCEKGEYFTKVSTRLSWLQRALVAIVGTRRNGIDPLVKGSSHLAVLLYVLTWTSALMFVAVQIWYTVDSIRAKEGHRVVGGVLGVTVVLFWVSITIYSRNQVRRLLSHVGISDAICWPSKTFFRVNVAGLVIFMMTSLFIINNYNSRMFLESQRFGNETLLNVMTQDVTFSTRLVFSVLALLWNTVVAILILSTCRTHTIRIRRFIRDLELDAAAYDKHFTSLFMGSPPSTEYNIFDEYIWLDQDDSERTFQVTSVNPGQNVESPVKPPWSPVSSDLTRPLHPNLATISEQDEIEEESSEILQQEDALALSTPGPNTFVNNCIARKAVSPNTCSSFVTSSEGTGFEPQTDPTLRPFRLLTLDEILHRYWKISCRLRLLSCAFQRWMVCFLSTCLAWTTVYLAFWLKHPPQILDVIQFIIPLLLVPMIGSAYAEVNYEGRRMLKFLCPLEERFFMLDYLNSNPLQMSVYDIQVTYTAIVTAILALFLALASGVILQEIISN